MTDPIADLLTRLRNALMAKHNKVVIPISKLKIKIVEILKREGFIKNYQFIKHEGKGYIRVVLKYDESGSPVINGLTRVSKPGTRIYADCASLPKVLNGLGIAIVSTNKGVLTDQECRKELVGGEVMCNIW